ncbi:VPS9 domain-containing protein 1 isoform X4 [Sus scrofa]|uniref:VPS9 domain-containing protein 1 isoform X4 n=1 Tax=Sus scrofa TaxID=9823 RepID=UPI000A2B3389|nr:VPS9 domain-containing protein 1 isoform X4 [Sus scrofa]
MAAAAGDGAVKPLQCAMKLANGAIELDTGNRPREAYTEYLRSVHYIAQVLLEEVEATKEAGDPVPPDTSKMLKLAEQCLERAQSTAAKLGGCPAESFPRAPPNSASPLGNVGPHVQALGCVCLTGKTRLKPSMPAAAPVPSPTSRHRRVYSDEGGKLSPFLPPEIFQKLQVVESQSSKKAGSGRVSGDQSIPGLPGAWTAACHHSREMTPLEEASLQNQKLKAAYEARMARLDPSQAMQKTSLTLSLQRQVMENLVIAKAREETLQRKMEERRLRLQEAANRCVCSRGRWGDSRAEALRPVLPRRRFCSQVALTPEEREQRALYAAILEYEQDHDWPKHWRTKLKKSPGDLSLVTSLVSHLLSVPDHPISQLLKKLQCAVYRALYPIVSRGAGATASAPGCCSLPPDADGLLAPGSRRLRPSQSLYCMPSPAEPSPVPPPPEGPSDSAPHRGVDSSPAGPPSPLADTSPHLPGKDSSFEDLEQFLATSERRGLGPGGRPEPQTPGGRKEPLLEQLKGVVQDIHDAIDRLLSLTLLAFEGLNTAASKDRCLACIEESFFSPLWPLLLAVYRSAHRLREAALSRSMELYRNAAPAAIGVPTKLLPRDPEAVGAGPYPYWAAAQELGLLVLETCPQKKLECIVRALRVVCACAEDNCRAQEAAPQPGTAAIGADDLLPILSFVALRSGLPQLVSECAALEEFIHERYLIGEEGYCLTSLQSALSYLELLPRGALGRS